MAIRRVRTLGFVLTCAAIGTGGCRPSADDREPFELVVQTDWSEVDADDDPFDDRPDRVTCEPLGLTVEDIGVESSLQVDTGLCHYATLEQPSLGDVRAGDTLFVRLWHYELNSATDDESAHVALQIGDELVWEITIPIPDESNMLIPYITVDENHSVDVPVYFHLHNHGANTWNLIEVTVIPPGR